MSRPASWDSRPPFDDWALTSVLTELEETRTKGYPVFELDLGRFRYFYPGAVIPLLAAIRSYATDIDVRVTLPSGEDEAYFDKSGWIDALEGEAQPHSHSASFTGVAEYRDRDALDAAMVGMREHLLSIDVFPAGVLDAFLFSIGEVTDNVLEHAGPGACGLMQSTFFRTKRHLEFVVADTGDGFAEAFRRSGRALADDREAIQLATTAGESSTGDPRRGYGLAMLAAIAEVSGGRATIRTGVGHAMLGDRVRYGVGPSLPSQMPGASVSLIIPTDRRINLNDILASGGRTSLLDVYVDPRSDSPTLRLCDFGTNFTVRSSARPTLALALNLAGQYSADELVIDLEGVPLVTWSFADELFRKAHEAIGDRLRIRGATPVVAATIDRVLGSGDEL